MDVRQPPAVFRLWVKMLYAKTGFPGAWVCILLYPSALGNCNSVLSCLESSSLLSSLADTCLNVNHGFSVPGLRRAHRCQWDSKIDCNRTG